MTEWGVTVKVVIDSSLNQGSDELQHGHAD